MLKSFVKRFNLNFFFEKTFIISKNFVTSTTFTLLIEVALKKKFTKTFSLITQKINSSKVNLLKISIIIINESTKSFAKILIIDETLIIDKAINIFSRKFFAIIFKRQKFITIDVNF